MNGTSALDPDATTLRFTKGHGTENDFVLLADPQARLDVGPGLVRALCDRRAGIGADGVIVAVPSQSLPEGRALLAAHPEAAWFMDYRNADGSPAQMCGNGARVFVAFLEREGLVDPAQAALVIGTRGGARRVRRERSGWYAIDMGPWRLPGGAEAQERGFDAEVQVGGVDVARPALRIELPNPHTVLALADDAELAAADLTRAPRVVPVPPEGTNVELVVPLGEEVDAAGRRVGVVRMRVHERGVGETRSCGTGACAAALAVRTWAAGGSGADSVGGATAGGSGGGAAAPDVWRVHVPGGELRVTVLPDGHVELAGPATLVAAGTVDVADLGVEVSPRPAR